jgi:UDP:flavonoid glycosyltransferase YjiC (YdhE family)
MTSPAEEQLGIKLSRFVFLAKRLRDDRHEVAFISGDEIKAIIAAADELMRRFNEEHEQRVLERATLRERLNRAHAERAVRARKQRTGGKS